jgi:hypothetical protein
MVSLYNSLVWHGVKLTQWPYLLQIQPTELEEFISIQLRTEITPLSSSLK